MVVGLHKFELQGDFSGPIARETKLLQRLALVTPAGYWITKEAVWRNITACGVRKGLSQFWSVSLALEWRGAGSEVTQWWTGAGRSLTARG